MSQHFPHVSFQMNTLNISYRTIYFRSDFDKGGFILDLVQRSLPSSKGWKQLEATESLQGILISGLCSQPYTTCLFQNVLLFLSQTILSQVCTYCDALSCLHLLFLSQTLISVSSLIASMKS